MKYLLVLAVLVVAFYWWRSNRAEAKGKAPAPPPPGQPPRQLQMVRCAVCGLHLPQGDAVLTARGSYCGVEHRDQAERRP